MFSTDLLCVSVSVCVCLCVFVCVFVRGLQWSSGISSVFEFMIPSGSVGALGTHSMDFQ